ncbi:hypothetical protein [Sulfuriflexus mobilis]|uniref:hypothetical protein n=1 Tax=Sulfuriflexus mobilis TaxID=1811807 RepID=UPI000F845968|nr:hypothetical protein [Sulfuriflexus mobilis]
MSIRTFTIIHPRRGTYIIMHKAFFTSLAILVTLVGNISPVAARADIDMPAKLKLAMAAYQEKGTNAFLPTLFGKQTSPEANSKILQETDILKEVEKGYGRYIGLEMVDAIKISDSTRIIFFIMKYQQGPLYGVITTYKINDRDEKITGFKVHTEMHMIIPVSLLSRYADQ